MHERETLNNMDIKTPILWALSVAVILAGSNIVGCAASRRAATASDATPLAADATQTCRATLHRIYGAKAQWALENRKTQTETPTDADLFGPGRYMPEKPKCPSGGSYTLGSGWENPRCSISGHTY